MSSDRFRFALAALVAALTLALATGSASALRSLSFNPGGRITLTSANFEERLTATTAVQSEVTFTGEIHRSIPKMAAASVGSITAAAIANCRTNPAEVGRCTSKTFLLERPWPITFNSFSGTLPNITSILITISNVKTLWRIERFELCLYTGNIGLISNGNPIRTFTILREASVLTLSAGEVLSCPSSERLVSTLTLEPNQTMTLL